MNNARSFPCLCRIKSVQDPDLLLGSASGLHGLTASVALGAEQECVRVLVSATGETALIDPAHVIFDLAPDVAMDVMDALEEAIEDALDSPLSDSGLVNALEATLALFDRCLEDS